MRLTQLSGMPKDYGWTDDSVLESADFKRWFKVVATGYVYIGGMSLDRKTKTSASLAALKAAGQADTVAAKSYEKALSGAVMNKDEALFWAATSMARKKRREKGGDAWYKDVMEKFRKKKGAITVPAEPVTAPISITKKIKPIYIIVPAIGIAGIIAFTFFLKKR